MGYKKIIATIILASAISNVLAFDMPSIGWSTWTSWINIPDVSKIGSTTSSWLTNSQNQSSTLSWITNVNTWQSWLNKTISWAITWDFTIDMFTTIDKDVVVDWWSLKLDVNADMKWFSIIAKNAKKISLWVNSTAATISWTVAEFFMDTNSESKNLTLTVSWATDLKENITIDKIALKTNVLNTSVNSDIKFWTIYVYSDFNGWVNSSFNWKLTVYWGSSLEVNSNVEWKFCSLWKVWLWVNANIKSYPWKWLQGNLDPILDVNIEDSSKTYEEITKLSIEFDSAFEETIKNIAMYNSDIASYKTKLSKAKEEVKASIQATLDSTIAEKDAMKKKFQETINSTFLAAEKYIDTQKPNTDLFAWIKNMYNYAIQFEDTWFVDNICNNAEINWDVNSLYEKDWKIIYWKKSFKRSTALSKSQAKWLEKAVSWISNDKLAGLESKLDDMVEMMIKSWKTDAKSLKKINTLLDLEDIIKDELLY